MMADEHITGSHGSTTIITTSYAPFGVKVEGGPPPRPEDPNRWLVRWMTREDICRELHLDESQFDIALTLGFPKPKESSTTGWWPKRIIEWKANKVFNWAERVRSLGLSKE